jgi:hypothetical protein
VGIAIDGVRDLVVAALVKAAQAKPDLRDIRVDTDGTRICIESVTEEGRETTEPTFRISDGHCGGLKAPSSEQRLINQIFATHLNTSSLPAACRSRSARFLA